MANAIKIDEKELDGMLKEAETATKERDKISKLEGTVRGVIRKVIITRMKKREKAFPVETFISQRIVKRYFLNRHTYEELKTKPEDKSIPALFLGKKYHRKEIARIKKAFLTIEKNVDKELVNKDKVDVDRVVRFMQLLWIQKEFYISKERVRELLNAMAVFYVACGERGNKETTEETRIK